MVDVTFQHPANIVISGSTGAGKSTVACKILQNKKILFSEEPKIVLWFYKEMQPLYRKLKEQNLVTEFFDGSILNLESIKQEILSHPKHAAKLIIFDDFMYDTSSFMSQIFTICGHHYSASILFLTQSLFHSGKEFRTISLNSHYLFLMKSPRDSSQIIPLARQIRPYNSRYIVEAYKEATKKPYSYILLDFHQNQNDKFRLRSSIFPKEAPMRIFIPTK